MAFDIIAPRRPVGPGAANWRLVQTGQCMPGYTAEYWQHKSGLFVISAVEAPEAEKLGPEYHLSVTLAGKRCTSNDARQVLFDFDILEADEDNHVPGQARHFWRPVNDELAGYVCPCKDEEPVIALEKGDYLWRPEPVKK